MLSLYVPKRPGSDNKRRNKQKKPHNQKYSGNQKRPARSYRNSGTDRKKAKSVKSRRGFNRDRRDTDRYNDKYHNKTKSSDRQYTHRQDRHRQKTHGAAVVVATKHNDTSESYIVLRDQLFEILGGGICTGCGFKDKRALGIASKYGDVSFDPADESAAASSLSRYVADAELAVSELVVLCLNCHRIREPISRSKKTSGATMASKEERKIKKSHKIFPR